MSLEIKISGKKLALSASNAHEWKVTQRPGGWIIFERGQERHRVAAVEQNGKIWAVINGVSVVGELVKKSAHSAQSSVGGDDSDLIAQFPGKVRKVLVKNGDQVKAGDRLALIEAMKMEFVVKAPYAGKIKKVLIQEGQPLSPGDRFVEIESSNGG